MFGRESSKAVIDSLLQTAASSTASTLTVIGDPGMGKSVLCGHAAARAREWGFTTVASTSMQWESKFELAAVTQILQPLRSYAAGLSQQDQARLRTAKPGHESPTDPFAYATAALACIVAAAEDRPLLIILDDAHWIDAVSASVLTFIIRRLLADSVAVLIAQRPGEVERFPHDWPHHMLPPLLTVDVQEMIASLRPDLSGLSAKVAQTIRDRAAGNPLVISEITPGLAAEQLTGIAPLPDPLPLGARGQVSFGARIAGLAPRTRLALGVVAAAGSQTLLVPSALVALGLAVGDLDEAAQAGLLTDGLQYRFSHPLYRAAAYADVSTSDRRAISRVLAELNQGVDDERFAWHLDAAGGDPAEVADAFEAAARVIVRRAGVAAGATTWVRAASLTLDPVHRRRRALQAAGSLFEEGDTPACQVWLDEILEIGAPEARSEDGEIWAGAVLLTCQASVWHAVDPMRLEQLMDLTQRMESLDPLRAAYAYGLLSGAFENAGHLSRANQLTDRAVRIAGDLPASSRLSALCWQAHTRTVARGAAQSAPIGRLVTIDTLRPLLEAEPSRMWTVAQTALWQEDFGFATQVCELAVAVLQRTSNIAWLPYTLAVQADTMWWTGNLERARASIAQAVELAVQTHQESLLGYLLATAGAIAATTDKREECEAFLQAALDHARLTGLEPVGLYTEHAYGLLHVSTGRFAAAVTHLERAHRLATHLQMAQPTVVPYLADYAEALIRSGEIPRGTEMVGELEEAARRSGSVWARATALRCRALLDPRTNRSHDWLVQSIELLTTTLDVPFERFRTELELGVQLRHRRHLVEARLHLKAASDGFATIGAVAWAQRTDAERRAAGDRAGAPIPLGGALGDLSPQQLQVVLAVAGGATNREAAAALFISPKTVDYHLRRAYTVLGVRSRVEVARLVAATGVVERTITAG